VIGGSASAHLSETRELLAEKPNGTIASGKWEAKQPSP
jgi:hypothetical protein